MSETPIESPAEDVAEQRAEVLRDPPAGTTDHWAETALEVDPVDAAEQGAEVPIDEDEWR
jgi:hypothetical protein